MQGHKRTYRFARMSTLKDRMKQARKFAQLTQKQLAERVGVSQPVISQLESGENLQSVHLLKIAEVCGVDPLWLSSGEGDGPAEAIESAETAIEAAPGTGKVKSAADMVRAMLATKAGKALPSEDRDRLLAVTAEPVEKPSNVIPADFSRNQARKGELLIPEFDIRAAMGAGQLPGDYVETVRNLVVNESHLRAHGVNYSAPEHLAMITGWGDSMTPTINDKDPVMVDRGVNEFIGEGLYVLTWHKHLFIKRVQLLDAEHFNLISDNDRYPNQTAKFEDVIFHAKVLLIWNARKG